MRAALWLALVLASPGCAMGMQHAYRVAPATGPSLDVIETQAMTVRTSATSGPPSFWFESDGETSGAFQAGLVEPASTIATGATTTTTEGRRLEAGDGDEAPDRQLYAQAQTSTTPPEATATDAIDTSGELLVYTALFHVGVYDVRTGQAAIAESARGVGGFVFAQGDDSIVVRVPAARFLDFTTGIDAGYDVLHREVQAQDVGDEFRDVEVRIRNLQAERDGIAALLERGLSVEQVLVVERELERVTTELEQMRARQRFLADRIAYSTVTVLFRPQPHDTIDQPEVFQLPFAWLESLGLPNLMELR